MDKYELKAHWLERELTLSLFFFAILYSSFSRKIEYPTCMPFNKTFERSGFKKIDDHLYEVYIVERMWTFDPEEIVVPQDQQ